MNEESQEKLKLFQKIYDESLNIVFFGGAGVSTESGIPDFRSVDGLYYQQWKFPPEQILSHTFFEKDTKEFYRFYRKKMLYPDAKPNTTHKVLAQMVRIEFLMFKTACFIFLHINMYLLFFL